MESTAVERREDECLESDFDKMKLKKGKSMHESSTPNGHHENGLTSEIELKKSKTIKEPDNIEELKIAYKPSDFKMIKEVGEGSYGRVYLAKRVSDGKKVAIKMLDKHHLIKSHKVDHVMREK